MWEVEWLSLRLPFHIRFHPEFGKAARFVVWENVAALSFSV